MQAGIGCRKPSAEPITQARDSKVDLMVILVSVRFGDGIGVKGKGRISFLVLPGD